MAYIEYMILLTTKQSLQYDICRKEQNGWNKLGIPRFSFDKESETYIIQVNFGK